MRLLLENFHRFITESEEDATLGKLLQLDPEHAASFIETLADIYPDIEKRYVEALEIKKERAEANMEKEYRIESDLHLQINRLFQNIENIAATQGDDAGNQAYRDNEEKLKQLIKQNKQASERASAFFKEVRKLKKAIEVFKPDLELAASVADAQATIDRFTKE